MITAQAPNGFVFSWIDTGLPGCRKMTINSTDYTATENYVQANQWVGLLNTAISGAGHGITFSTSTGLVTLTLGSSLACEWADQTGYLCGFDRAPGTSETFTTLESRVVPPAMVWLIGAIWEEIEITRDLELQIKRWRRGYGYRFGGNRVFRCKLTCHQDAVAAFQSGWAATGKITIWTGDNADLSGSNSDGQIVGHVLGVESVDYLGPTREYAEISLILAKAV